VQVVDYNYQSFAIAALLENDKVIAVIYVKGRMTDQDLDAIRLTDGQNWAFVGEHGGEKVWVTQDLMFVSSNTKVGKGAMIFYCKDAERWQKVLGTL
jgi:hypothetical protein